MSNETRKIGFYRIRKNGLYYARRSSLGVCWLAKNEDLFRTKPEAIAIARRHGATVERIA